MINLGLSIDDEIEEEERCHQQEVAARGTEELDYEIEREYDDNSFLTDKRKGYMEYVD
eukprot:CAMPEP_0206211492 /NCGR_PEP_ID=MMETSP0047_2-20121206/10_1 /ASSEMBLY_ACC=CAM_ASM_000192 /TAXON_ID=195065 /ORGANISM="Chroomonas mesostigmatica_cf, Strain CCMP1168" /LENGTH=57 /DNA_ID=CAMNT_0053633363 /DNA_START=156 /DNA_END=329 /DNA_ORIENTATION=-